MPFNVAVAGAGAWGTTLAILFDERGASTTLLARNVEEAEMLTARRVNERLLPGVRLPSSLAISANSHTAVAGADLLVLAVPAQSMRLNVERLSNELPAATVVLSASKGLQNGTGLRMSQVIATVLAGRNPVLVLSGPNLSGEIARGLPAATVIAGPLLHSDKVRMMQQVLSCERFRVYSSDDVVGVELGGALKNVVAIAAGICDGMGFGHNARAGLMTRGLAEMTRLAVAAGADPRTLAGLSGLGDLVATIASPRSRNYGLGVKLGRGARLSDLMASSAHVIEGVSTAGAALELAQRLNVDLPITRQLEAVIRRGYTTSDDAAQLMRRAAGSE